MPSERSCAVVDTRISPACRAFLQPAKSSPQRVTRPRLALRITEYRARRKLLDQPLNNISRQSVEIDDAFKAFAFGFNQSKYDTTELRIEMPGFNLSDFLRGSEEARRAAPAIRLQVLVRANSIPGFSKRTL